MKHSTNRNEQSQWEQLVESTFERPVPKVPVMRKKSLPKMPKWLPIGAAAVLVIIFAVGILLTLPETEAPAQPQLHIPQELLACKDALDQWQALDSYKITGTFTRYGSAVKSATEWHEQYWVSGEEWVMFNSAYKQVLTSSSHMPPAGYMYRDGKRYIAYSDTDPAWSPEPETDREDNSLGLWPMTFRWDTCELVYINTIHEDYANTVRFAVIDRTEETPSVYHVEFQMKLGGTLNSIAVIQSRSNGTIAKDSYILSSTDAETIAEYIADQPLLEMTDAQLPEISVE